ncbi:MAG: DUF969 domain-containing protein [Burkholderiales bacterium]|nr:DUF969 domain-containing protein [Burkholderiales bacterium]
MQHAVSLWPLIGVAVVIVGFLLRFNPVLVVTGAGIVTGLAAHMPLDVILAKLGTGFVKTRNLPLILILPLPVIGLLERHGLRERAQQWIGSIRSATAGRLLIVYLFVREIAAALGLTGLGGHAQMVRPLIAPMAEAAAETQHGPLPMSVRYRLRALAAATDNVGLFFGEDIFVAFGSIILMHTFLREAGVSTEPLQIAAWGIPTAMAAFMIHATRLYRLDGKLPRYIAQAPAEQANAAAQPEVA